jgi:hypothetical protein
VVARLQPGNCEMFDYLLLPDFQLLPEFQTLTERLFLTEKPGKLDPYRFERLDVLPGLFKHQACWKGQDRFTKT